MITIQGNRVVMKLLESYLGKHYKVYFDNFYTSPKLVVDLLKNKTYCSGTVRSNRQEFPTDIGPRLKLSHGSIVFRACGSLELPVTALRFTDKRDVWCMSTICGTTTQVTVRQQWGGSGEEAVEITEIINDYMSGVDVVDQHLAYYAIGRKGLKWWRRVFYRLWDVYCECICNTQTKQSRYKNVTQKFSLSTGVFLVWTTCSEPSWSWTSKQYNSWS